MDSKRTLLVCRYNWKIMLFMFETIFCCQLFCFSFGIIYFCYNACFAFLILSHIFPIAIVAQDIYFYFYLLPMAPLKRFTGGQILKNFAA